MEYSEYSISLSNSHYVCTVPRRGRNGSGNPGVEIEWSFPPSLSGTFLGNLCFLGLQPCVWWVGVCDALLRGCQDVPLLPNPMSAPWPGHVGALPPVEQVKKDLEISWQAVSLCAHCYVPGTERST